MKNIFQLMLAFIFIASSTTFACSHKQYNVDQKLYSELPLQAYTACETNKSGEVVHKFTVYLIHELPKATDETHERVTTGIKVVHSDTGTAFQSILYPKERAGQRILRFWVYEHCLEKSQLTISHNQFENIHRNTVDYVICLSDLSKWNQNRNFWHFDLLLEEYGDDEGDYFLKEYPEFKKKKFPSNQRVDLTVKTPVESDKTQGTAGHP